MVRFYQALFTLIWIGALIILAGALLFAGAARSGQDLSGVLAAARGSFWTLIAATVVQLLCEIAEALNRLAPRPVAPPPPPPGPHNVPDARPWAQQAGPGM